MKPLLHSQCLFEAAKQLSLSIEKIDAAGVVNRVFKDGRPSLFIASGVPLNTDTDARLCVDKAYTYDLLHQTVQMPRTQVFIDPHHSEYGSFSRHKDWESIRTEITQHFSFPLIIKRNSGSEGQHVYKCSSDEEVAKAIETIFNPAQQGYDHVLLAQEYIEPHTEFRGIFLDGELILLYEKSTVGAEFTGNLSPLHWQGSRAVQMPVGTRRGASVREGMQPVFAKWPIRYVGVDVILDHSGKLWLIELNARPGYEHFIADNGTGPIVEVYRQVLSSL